MSYDKISCHRICHISQSWMSNPHALYSRDNIRMDKWQKRLYNKRGPRTIKIVILPLSMGGIITIVDDGQVETPSPNLDRETPLNVETKQLDYKRKLNISLSAIIYFPRKAVPRERKKITINF